MSSASLSTTLDKLAVSTSTVCAIHCLCLPLLLAVFPAIGATLFGQESFHQILLWVVIPLSVVGLTLGCRRHKDALVALLGLAGLTVLVLVAVLGHSTLGEVGERTATLVGSCAIAIGHVRNYLLCRGTECDH
ncbi:MAG: MerC domain-containing protein [Hyphomicrobiaceae bacterium]